MPRPGRPKGIPKTGGRKKGTPNLDTAERARRSTHCPDVELNIKRVLGEYSHIAFLDPRGAFDEAGRLKPMEMWPDDFARAVAGFEFQHGQIHKIRLSSKISALDSIGKHLGMFIDRTEHAGELTIKRLIGVKTEDI